MYTDNNTQFFSVKMNSIPTVENSDCLVFFHFIFVFYQYYMTMQLLYFDSAFFSLQLPYLIITFSCSSTNTRTCVINTLALWFVGEQLSLISSIYEIHTSCYIVLRLLFQGASTAWTTLGGNLCLFTIYTIGALRIAFPSTDRLAATSIYSLQYWKITGKAKYPICLPLIRSFITIDLPQRRNYLQWKL